jgi:hypothetical protein
MIPGLFSSVKYFLMRSFATALKLVCVCVWCVCGVCVEREESTCSRLKTSAPVCVCGEREGGGERERRTADADECVCRESARDRASDRARERASEQARESERASERETYGRLSRACRLTKHVEQGLQNLGHGHFNSRVAAALRLTLRLVLVY